MILYGILDHHMEDDDDVNIDGGAYLDAHSYRVIIITVHIIEIQMEFLNTVNLFCGCLQSDKNFIKIISQVHYLYSQIFQMVSKQRKLQGKTVKISTFLFISGIGTKAHA